MTSQKLHKAYASVRQIVRAFTDNLEQCNFRVNLIVNNLYHDKLLSDATLIGGVVVERTEDDEDMSRCEVCSARVLTDELVSHRGNLICPACYAAWLASPYACTHLWTEAYVAGQPGHICDKCGWFLRVEVPVPVQGKSFLATPVAPVSENQPI